MTVPLQSRGTRRRSRAARDPDSVLAAYRNRHAGETIVVCGCGSSLNELPLPCPLTTVGVNDVGRLFDPTYLVVLNPRTQFAGDRFRWVERSRAKALFTQLDLGIDHPNVVRFQLARRGSTELDGDRLPYTQNSPYVALCLAIVLGARRIGLIGVDFTDHHFFARTGRHPLTRSLKRIDDEYRTLGRIAAARGVEILNLSSASRLTAFPKRSGPIVDWLRENTEPEALAVTVERRESAGTGGPSDAHSNASDQTGRRATPSRDCKPSRHRMRVAIQAAGGGLVGTFLDALADSSRKLNHQVLRTRLQQLRPDALSIVWNGRNARGKGPVLYCEHGWLPRWSYQVSPEGINAGSHLAPWKWDRTPPSDELREQVANHLLRLRLGGDCATEYTRTETAPVSDLAEPFFLVPLQIENDTNIVRHAPAAMRRMQALIDRISASDPPLPVVFKQHPADQRQSNRQLRLRVRRPQDSIRPHSAGNIHQLLKTGSCRGVLSINSNVVHDAMIWDVPALVLGRNIWPQSPPAPFFLGLPRNWSDWWRFTRQPEAADCRVCYAAFLIENQWTLEQARDLERVDRLLREHTPRRLLRRRRDAAAQKPSPRASRRRARSGRPMVNVVASDRGWLFEDLKRQFAGRSRSDVSVIASQRPLRQADAWIFLRTAEAASTPDARRTVVQIHDLFDEYGAGSRRRRAIGDAALSLTHPLQRTLLERSGVDLAGRRMLLAPLGADERFRLRTEIPPKFTVAWIGRPVVHRGIEVKRIDRLVRAVEHFTRESGGTGELSVVLIGERLEGTQATLRRMGVDNVYFDRRSNPFERYPDLYLKLDAVLITASLATGPNCLFEALATGLPVVSTRVGWAETLIRDGENGFLVDTPEQMAAALRRIADNRPQWFARRRSIRRSLSDHKLGAWLDRNLDLARELSGASRALAEPGR